MARFYTNHNVSFDIAVLLRQDGHDVVTAQDLGLEKVGDDEHLLVAAQQNRIFVTHNIDDYELLQDAWRRWSAAWRTLPEHAGVLIIPQPPLWRPDRAARELAAFVLSDTALTNALYRWQAVSGWERRPEP